MELGERLDAGVPCSDEDEAELGGRPPGSRGLESLEDMVAQRDRVCEVLEASPVLDEPGNGEDACHRAECDHEPLVGDRGRPGERLGGDRPRAEIQRLGPTEEELCVRAHLA